MNGQTDDVAHKDHGSIEITWHGTHPPGGPNIPLSDNQDSLSNDSQMRSSDPLEHAIDDQPPAHRDLFRKRHPRPRRVVPQDAKQMDQGRQFKILCTILSTSLCIIGIIVIPLYCPWPACPCVTITDGKYLEFTIRHSDHGYMARYQYNISKYNTTNCYRSDNSRTYQTYNLAEQNAIYSDYINFTRFSYDTRTHECYDVGDDTLSGMMAFAIIVVWVSGCFAVTGWGSLLSPDQ